MRRPHEKDESVPVNLAILTATAAAQPCKVEEQDPVKPHASGKRGRRRRAAATPAEGSQPTPAESAHDVFYLYGGEAANRSKYCVLRYDPRQQQTEKMADWQDRANTTFNVIGDDNTIEVFASSAAMADSGNNLKSWRWSSRKPAGTLDVIVGAGCLC
ncbi:unnamed protein product [Dibothriocephalus latus]|uniref:Uncharacterized protein n=1 Tax=Dibothriocephalus latus TaxID=60516 RepID=A0A3P7L9B8_DIBLA|nr:unnamed protein product [Dibothriocephalus latus]